MNVTVADGVRRPQFQAEMKGSTEEDIGHAEEREGVEGPMEYWRGGGGGQEVITLREASWKRKPGSRVGSSEIWERGGTHGGHTVANLISKGRRLILP